MSTDLPSAGPLTLNDVRMALGDTDPNGTNAGALRRVLGRGSFSTIQKHLDTIRQEIAAPLLEATGAAPDAPKDLIQSLWSVAWTAAQARTAGALAQAQALTAQQAQALAVARVDAQAAQQEADEATQALAAAHQLAAQQAIEAAQAFEQAQQGAQAVAEQMQGELVTLRQELAQATRVMELERVQAKAVEATLRGELDRQVSQLADLRAALGSKAV